ncbi:DUF397 domain-containing protein [Nocardia sp. BMG51109]|uniref:DUF397 domain-containing protein n=1 Tax=Nocardia sp. BMG51109 TaxID=1056816 RepID=UPI000463BC48|nr:DUF397 domain-containing protein [Nocardia sp. BMG51109]
MSTAARYRPEATGWFTSTRTNNGNQCVEVRFDGAAVFVRDSKFRRDPADRPEDEPVIAVTAGEWMAFLDAVLGRAAGPTPGALTAAVSGTGGAVVRCGDVELGYTAGEWAAFVAGARDGEFDRVPVPG